MTDPRAERLHALGTQLIEVHRYLRDQLRRLRDDRDDNAEARPLLVRCIAFCDTLTRHHMSEDQRTFPLLAAEFPQLRPILDKLEEDHQLISGILRNVDQLVRAQPAEPSTADRERFHGELDGLAAIMESHFAFEERRIVAALDELDDPALDAAQLFGLSGRS